MAGFIAGVGIGVLLSLFIFRWKTRRLLKKLGKRFFMSTMCLKDAVSAWNELTAYQATDMTPEEIRTMKNDFDVLAELSRNNPNLFARASGLDICQVACLTMFKGLPARQRENIDK